MPPKAEVDPGLRTAEFGLAGAAVVGVGALLAVAPNAMANNTSNAEVEKQALAAFGPNAITRTIESFPAPRTQASTLEIGRLANSSTAEATATEASVSYIPEDDQPSSDTPPPAPVEETPPPEVTPPEEVPPANEAELKKLCVSTGLPFETIYSHMVRPGLLSKGPSQSVEGRFLYKLMPKFCEDKFKRFASFLVKIKDKAGNKWQNMTSTGKKRWDSLYIDETGEFLDAKENGEAVGDLSLYPSGHGGIMNDPNSYFFNKTCRKVVSFIRTRVVKDKPRKVYDFPGQPGLYRLVYPIAGQKIKKVGVELLGKCAKRVKR